MDKFILTEKERRRRRDEEIKLTMACLVLYNVWCHALRREELHSVDSVKVVVDYSDIIDEQTLTRYSTHIDEMTYKELIVQKYVHGCDADVSPYPHAAVAKTVKKKKKRFDDPDTQDIDALVSFRDYRDNIVKDYAIDFVTKMYDIHKMSQLSPDQQKKVVDWFTERRIRLRGAKDKRLEKKREEKKLAYEAWVQKQEENKRMLEELAKKRP